MAVLAVFAVAFVMGVLFFLAAVCGLGVAAFWAVRAVIRRLLGS